MQARKIGFYYALVKESILKGWVKPITCEIDPSNSCNLDCSFCIYKQLDDETHLSLELYKKILGDLRDCEVKSITFTGGGEPLLNPRINEMIEVSSDFKLGLITNGVLLDKIRPKLLKRFEFVRVSLNAGTPKTYKNITGKDLFSRVIKNIHSLKKHIKQLGISFVVTKENIDEIDLVKGIKADYIQIKDNVLNPIDYSADCIVCKRDKAVSNLPCSIASLIGVIGGNGDVSYCCQYRYDKRFILGNVKRDSFIDIWERRKDIRPIFQNCPPCRYNNYAQEFEIIDKLYNKEFL